MNENNLNSNKGFKYAILAVVLCVILIILIQWLSTLFFDIASIVIGIFTIAIGILSIRGLVKSLKGIKEPNTIKKVIAIVINFTIVALFISVLIVNIYDIYKAFAI